MDALRSARQDRLRALPRGLRGLRPGDHGVLSLFVREREVPEAVDRCPSCGAQEWVERRPMFGRARVVCRACGYTVEGWSELAAVMVDAEVDDEPALPDLTDAPASDFPVYALDGWEGDQAVAGWSSVQDAITDVSLTYEDEHGALVVVRSTAPADWDEPGVKALEALEEALGDDEDAAPSDPAAAEVWLDAREHFDRDRMAQATSRRIGLPVDDRRVEFALVEVDEAWGAAARIEGVADVLISGRDCRPESLALVRAR